MSETTTPINPEYQGRCRRMRMMIRREFWEHRAMWMLPLVLVVLVFLGSLLALATPSRINANLRQDINVEVDGKAENLARALPGLSETSINLQLGDFSTENLFHFFDQMPPVLRERMLFLALFGQSKMLLMPLGFLVALLAL